MLEKYLNIKNIVILSLIIRIMFLIGFTDLKNLNYWEYGTITQNLVTGNGYTYYYFDSDNNLQNDFNPKQNHIKSAYMPPGYIYTLAPFFLIDNVEFRNILILGFQIIISVIILLLIYRLTNKFYNMKIGLIASLIYTLYPEFIYTSISIGTTVFYHLFILLIFYLYSKKRKNILLISLILGISLYFRPELLLFYFIITLYFLFQKNIRTALIPLIIGIIIFSPWVLRNYIVFDKFPLITTSSGQNFYRGHNTEYPGVWADEKLDSLLNKIPTNENYELNRSELMFDYALNQIKNYPVKEITNDLEKVLHLWTIYYYDSRSFNPIYIISWTFLFSMFIFGYIKSNKSKLSNITLLFLLYHTILAIIFFALIRYQTMMKIALVPIAAYGIYFLINTIKRKNYS